MTEQKSQIRNNVNSQKYYSGQ